MTGLRFSHCSSLASKPTLTHNNQVRVKIHIKELDKVSGFKSLYRPLTYLGVERTLFYFVCVGAVGVFNLFESLLAGIIVFIGGYAFGRWITGADPAMLRILAQSERFRPRYDAGKQDIPAVEVR
jgi:type IV secretory pathway TrbD component